MLNQTFSIMILTGGGILTLVLILFAALQKSSRGEWYWVSSSISMTVAMAMFVLRGSISQVFSVIVGNVLFVLGIVQIDAGLRAFQARRTPRRTYAGIVASLTLLLVVFTYWLPNTSFRIIIVSSYAALLFGALAVRLLTGVPSVPGSLPIYLGAVYALTALFFIYRVFADGLAPGYDPLGKGVGVPVTYLMYVLAMGAWMGGSVGFIILKNQSLHRQLEEELAGRITAQAMVEQSAQRLKTLHDMYQGILEIEPLTRTALSAVSKLRQLSSSCGGLVVVIDTSRQSATVLATSFGEVRIPSSEEAELMFGGSIDFAGWLDRLTSLLESKREYLMTGSDDLALMEPLMQFVGPCNPKAFLVAPMRVSEELNGLIVLGSDDEATFQHTDSETAVEFAYAVSLAIYNTRIRNQLTEHAHSVEQSLAEKEVLLREVHHRVKNNLQVISSLLYLQANAIRNREIQSTFKQLQNRVRSIAFVHEQLYRSNSPAQVQFGDYVSDFVHQLVSSFGVSGEKVRIVVEDTDTVLGADVAVPLGLIINELVSNSLKYAFPEDRVGEIRIALSAKEDDSYVMTLSDNGIGISEIPASDNDSRIGLKIIGALARQIHGKWTFTSQNGTIFTLRIPKRL